MHKCAFRHWENVGALAATRSRWLLERLQQRFLLIVLSVVFFSGCWTKYRDDLDYSYRVQQTWPIEELHHGEIVQFESVFWEPDDTISLRKLIADDMIATGRDVLEIGTGTGLLSILCLQNDARRVVATDINEAAVANARYNAAMLVPDKTLEVRQVVSDNPQAFSIIEPTERFDLILSNPPWEDGYVSEAAEHAFYDPGFGLMTSLLDGLPTHLNPGGRCLLAYGHRPAIEKLQADCERRGYEFKILDDRDLSSLDVDFLPGMLVEIRVPLNGAVTKPTPTADASSEAVSKRPDNNQADENQADPSEPELLE